MEQPLNENEQVKCSCGWSGIAKELSWENDYMDNCVTMMDEDYKEMPMLGSCPKCKSWVINSDGKDLKE